MKKFLILVVVVAMMTALIAAPVMAAGKNGQSGKSNIGHLYLWEKVRDDSAPWPIVEDGAWGKMKYNLSGPTFDFVFNGHGLVQLKDYTLIYYPDPWPGFAHPGPGFP